MLQFVTDEHVPVALVQALLAREPGLDIVRSVEIGLRTANDSALLDWAAAEGRVVLSEDRNTMIGLVRRRMAAGHPFGGLVIYRLNTPSAVLVEDVLTVAFAATPEDLAVQILYIPI